MPTSKYIVALVDDDPDDRELFLDAVNDLENRPDILQFENGRAFLDYLKGQNENLPNLIFLDLNMPIMGGIECLKELRALEGVDGLPVVIYSTSSSMHHIDEAYSLGADLYTTKPHDFANLKKCISTILQMGMDGRIKNPTQETFKFKI